ncbi:MAG: B12-binding domain-containing radical SAM protein [Proteobacteria bacterium]|nr:B12-binding domain-containing radical SAM protein [Pseudomonadota bacterium]
MKKILFVNPSSKETIFGKMKTLVLPPMGLAIMATLTPEKFQVSIIDENVESLDFNTDADLVAITASTVQAPRAYQILGEFKRRGIPTVMGGIHASVMPDEAANYADTVVTGEAEDIWGEVLRDFDEGAIKKRYRVDTYPTLENLPATNRNLFSKKYVIHSVQTSRGCPCDCSFCSVTKFNGKKYRFRPVDQVVKEIAGMNQKRLFISDDSIVGLGKRGTEHAKRLFAGLKDLNISWGSQVCITIAEHEDLLRAASEAGANTFYIGFESIEAESLKYMNKNINLRPAIKNYKETIQKFHDYGIGVIGGFILGADTDTKDSFKKIVDFVYDTKIDGCQFTIMTPFPGTRFYAQMEEENRLLYTDYPNDWARYNCYEAIIKPKNMTVDELKEGHQYVYEATATMGKSLSRSVKTLFSTRSLTNALTNLFFNYYSHKAIKGVYR